MKILLLEDDIVLGEIILEYLKNFYEIDHVYSSKEAEELTLESSYDLYIFDINVTGKSGIELLRDLRHFNDHTPTLLITAYTDTKYIRAGFDAGAHDYIRKPFELEELLLRIEKSRSLFHIEQNKVLNLADNIRYFPSTHKVIKEDKEYKLRPKEKEILEYFIANPHRVISSNEFYQNIWEFDQMPSDATFRSYIRKLREILGAEKIKTQRGIRYRYE